MPEQPLIEARELTEERFRAAVLLALREAAA